MKYVFPKDFSPMAKDFVSKILVKNPALRLKLSEMKAHAWITSKIDKINVETNYN